MQENRLKKRFFRTTQTLLLFALMNSLGGCVRLRIIESDRQLHRLPRGQSFTPSVDGWFYPDAVHLEIAEQLEKKLIEQETK